MLLLNVFLNLFFYYQLDIVIKNLWSQAYHIKQYLLRHSHKLLLIKIFHRKINDETNKYVKIMF